MTQMLLKNDSAAKVQRAVRRHLRLARRTTDDAAKTLAPRIAGPSAALDERIDALAGAHQQADDAFDDWWQDDQRLDRVVRSAYRKCADWDADHAGAKTTALLFGDRAPSELTAAPRGEEPELVAQLVARGASLPEAHPARALLADLDGRAKASRAAHRAWVDAEQRVAAAEAAAETARLVVVRAYRDNFIDIERASGADVVGECFPPLRRAVRGGADEGHPAAHEGEPSAKGG